MSIAENLLAARAAIATAATKAGRNPAEVQLVAVSKTRPASDVQEAMAAGQLHFGENRVQELVEKYEIVPQAKWHLIGSLQRNKVKYIAPFVHLIHSVDSERLLAEIDRQAGLCGRVIDCLLQLNISNEDQKGGMTEPEAASVLAGIAAYPHVRILGLMGMAEFTDDEAVIAAQFGRLAAARASLAAYVGPQVDLRELSMGMSGDFELAIAAGATMVRIGSSIFGSR